MFLTIPLRFKMTPLFIDIKKLNPGDDIIIYLSKTQRMPSSEDHDEVYQVSGTRLVANFPNRAQKFSLME